MVVLAIFLVAIAAVVVLTGGLLKRKAEQGGKSSTIMEPGKSAILLDVTGSVSAKGGRPLPVRATVFVASARPRPAPAHFARRAMRIAASAPRPDGQAISKSRRSTPI